MIVVVFFASGSVSAQTITVTNNSTCDYWVFYRYGTTPCCAMWTGSSGWTLVSGGTTHAFTPPAGNAPCRMAVAEDAGGPAPPPFASDWTCAGDIYVEVTNCNLDTDAIENNGWIVKIDTL